MINGYITFVENEFKEMGIDCDEHKERIKSLVYDGIMEDMNLFEFFRLILVHVCRVKGSLMPIAKKLWNVTTPKQLKQIKAEMKAIVYGDKND